MKKTKAAVVLTAAMIMMMVSEMAGAHSAPIVVNTSPSANRYWETVYSNEVDVVWRWDACPANAAYAELLISGMNGIALTTNVTRSISNVLWRVFATQSPAEEDVFDLKLTLFDSENEIVGVQTSRLAIMKGAFGAISVDPDPAGEAWARLKGNVMIPYDAGWRAETTGAAESLLVIAKEGGMTQTNALVDAAGFFGWKIRHSQWGYGAFNLALTFPEIMTDAWEAALTRVPEGMMIKVQ